MIVGGNDNISVVLSSLCIFLFGSRNRYGQIVL